MILFHAKIHFFAKLSVSLLPLLGLFMKYLLLSSVLTVVFLCTCRKNVTTADAMHSDSIQAPQTEVHETRQKVQSELVASKSDSIERAITPEMAYEGVNNYCHREYDWSVAEGNPSIMSVTMGEETESEYKVVFRSYTGAFVYFYVEKASGRTRMVEYEPRLDAENEAGTINLYDYLK